MDFKQIQELIKIVSKSNLSEVKIEEGEFKITIRTHAEGGGVIYGPAPVYAQPVVQQPVAPATPAPTATAAETPAAPAEKPAPAAVESSKHITVKSPMIGTFYRSPGPDKEPFVKVGDNVAKGSTICIIEAMKLFNEIESEYSGKIIKMLVEDASPVEYDQPLFIIDPS